MKPSLHQFEFRFRRKVAKGHSSATEGPGSLLKAVKGHSQVWKFVFVFREVTTSLLHASRLLRQNLLFFSPSRSPPRTLSRARALTKKRRVHPTTKRKFHHTINSLLSMTSSKRSGAN